MDRDRILFVLTLTFPFYRAISMLKMDRFLADANWDMVEKYTFIINPYHKKDTDDKKLMIDEFLYPSMRYSNCPECHSKVFNEPTPKEQFEMANDARVRYLKTEKVGYGAAAGSLFLTGW